MSFWTILLWVVFPYIALASMIIGIIWRWRTDKFGWTTRSSETYERKWLRITSPLFHYGILLVILGHFAGLVIPQSWTSAMGVSEHLYHAVAVSLGSVAGILTIAGMVGLLIRRYVVKSVRFATSPSDIVMYVLLAAAVGLGAFATAATQIFGVPGGYDYRETISPWFRSLFYLNPQPELMVGIPWQFTLHVTAGFLLFAVWPYTRLVHAVSLPVNYPMRPYMVYRSRGTEVGSPGYWQGGEPVPTYMLDKADTEKKKYRTSYGGGRKPVA